MDNIPFNVLNTSENHKQESLDRLASLINSSGYNRGQRRRLEKALSKTTKLSQKCKNKIGKELCKEFQDNLDSNMRRFFSVLGIVLKDKYGFEESEDKEEISTMFNELNKVLREYRDTSTDELAKICYEKTGLELVADDKD